MAMILGALAVAGASFALAGLGSSSGTDVQASPSAAVDLPADAPTSDTRPLAQVDAAIATWTANLAAEPKDFIAAVNLGELYLARTRISGDAADIDRATDAADRALDADPGLAAARLLRAQAAHAAHDFAAAEADALVVLDAVPDAPEALAALGDARFELGRYTEAADTYARLDERADGPAIDARLARLAAMTGRLDDARVLAASATRAATDEDVAPATLAWYHGLEAALAFQAGDLAAAEAAWRAAVVAWDGSAAAHAGLGRTLAAIDDLRGARLSLERAVVIQPQPDSLRLLAEVQDLLGDSGAAATTRATFVAVAELGGHDRQLALFLADRGEEPERAVRLARTDLALRGDVHAHDTLAWALLSAGRPAEADLEMRAARSAGTEDSLLDYHAGMIALALGRDADARDMLTDALERHPGFDLVGAERARQALAMLDGSAGR
ncbi:MAG: tetratricopeptide repeat protein [Candidatus Limnocylindria bacterium]